MAQAQAESSSHAELKIHGLTPFSVQTIKHYLHHLDHAYVCVAAFETLFDSVLERLEYIHPAVVAMPEDKRTAKIARTREEALRLGIWRGTSSQAIKPSF